MRLEQWFEIEIENAQFIPIQHRMVFIWKYMDDQQKEWLCIFYLYIASL